MASRVGKSRGLRWPWLSYLRREPFCLTMEGLSTGRHDAGLRSVSWGHGHRLFEIGHDWIDIRRQIRRTHTPRPVREKRPAREALLSDCRDYLSMLADKSFDPRLRGKCAPSDIVQNTMVNATTGFGQFRGDNTAALRAWLREILRNEMAMTHRRYLQTSKRDVRRELVSPTDSQYFRQNAGIKDRMPTPSTEAVLQEDAAELRAALLRLSEDHRSVLIMRNWERMTFAQIGQRMQRSENAAKKLWARALTQLESELFGG